MPTIKVFTAIALVFGSVVIANGNSDEYSARLNKVQKQISVLEQSLNKYKGQRANHFKQLQKVEEKLANITVQREVLQNDLTQVIAEIKSLTQQYNKLQLLKRQQEVLVREELQSAYKIGERDQIKLLLSQDNPEEIARMLKYFQYIAQARSHKIESFLDTMQQIKRVSEESRNQKVKLQQLQAELEQQRKNALNSKRERQALVAKYSNSIADTSEQLKVLQQQQKELQQLIDNVIEITEEIRAPEDVIDIAKLKGKLRRPVSGKIANRYNAQRIGGLRWTGLFIQSEEGKTVRAIHYGHVVFSGYLRGMGLLTIIDHGNQYLSLYGHNQTLKVGVGDWITPGQTIATVGNTGGQQRSGLYFELRYKGRTQNPSTWVKW